MEDAIPVMKQSKIGIAVALICLSARTHAQGSATLFGAIDEGLNLSNNTGGSKSLQMASGYLASSRWGLKGDEGIHGGLHALFDLESGFLPENGNLLYTGRLFGFQSTIGVESDILGTLTIGRQFDAITDTVGPLTANGSWAGFLFSHPLDNDNTDGSFHANNSIKYTSHTYAGSSVTAMYGFSNLAGGFGTNRIYAVGLSETYGALKMAAVYEQLSAAGATSSGSVSAGDQGFTAGKQKIWGVAAGYETGKATLNLVYTHTNICHATESIYVGALSGNPDLRFDNIEANFKYNIAPDLLLGFMYTYTLARISNAKTDSSLHWNQIGAMAQYRLSVRTSVYGQVVYQRISANSVDNILDTALITGALGASSNHHQAIGRIGILHLF
ncbi:porin [Paraburkholderia caribensis]|nr:porin [Paraburkholderia caribensis]